LSEALLKFGPATYRPVEASEIAAAMVATAQREPRGITVIESREISRVTG
jgi:hypothetical protein